MKLLPLLLTCFLASTPLAAYADFTYQETTQVTGGSIVGMMKMAGIFSKQARQASDPIVSTVMVKGNKMIRIGKDTSEIIDLDAETITEIDHQKKQYTTMTFAQMRQQMEAAMAKAKAQQAKQPVPAAPDKAQQVDVKFTVKVRNTDATRDVAGLNAKESIMTMTMDATDQSSGQTGSLAITNDMYLTPEIPGYEEVRDFYKRFAVKMGTVMSGAINSQMLAMLQQPAAGKGMADMVKEMSKLKGVPVLQIMRMGTTVDGTPLPAASEAPLPTGPPPPSVGDIAKSAVMSSLPFGGFGRKKKQEDPPPAASSGQPTAAVLIESTTQVSQFSKASLDASQFNPPLGYKQVELKPIE
ncbi:MAG: hypothetical protein M3O31_16810 [Acidobacteriota bacterium]|nr:hypothetical protein [Acidobacteriota bacterium]